MGLLKLAKIASPPSPVAMSEFFPVPAMVFIFKSDPLIFLIELPPYM